jgi:uncharacterized protein YqgV (UPF0045/DUF77 family)
VAVAVQALAIANLQETLNPMQTMVEPITLVAVVVVAALEQCLNL